MKEKILGKIAKESKVTMPEISEYIEKHQDDLKSLFLILDEKMRERYEDLPALKEAMTEFYYSIH